MSAAMLRLSLSSLVLLICSLCTFSSPAEAQSASGICTESSNNASSCDTFCDLEYALLNNVTNKIALSITFFPLENNPPEFVKVTYNFGEGKDPQVWYWSEKTSNFIHPFEILHFLSLFFNKPAPYYSGTVHVTLDPDCAATGLLPNTGVPQLQLLTQRLKLYAKSGSPHIALSDTYSAKAYNDVTLRNLIERKSEQITNVIITMAVFVVFFSFIIIFLMMTAFLYSSSHTQSEWFKRLRKNRPAAFSFTVLSIILTILILLLDGFAIDLWWKQKVKYDFFYSFDRKRNLGPITTVLIVDILAIIIWGVMVIIAGCTYKQKHSLIILSLTVLCPFLCVIAHSPYIALAYLNDGSHASSIFIYYTVLIYVFFGIMWLFFHWCEHYSKTDAEDTVGNAGNEEDIGQRGQGEHGDMIKRQKQTSTKAEKRARQCGILFLLGVTLLALLGLVTTATCYFVFIPINRSISDAPSVLFSIFQSGGFVIGSFILYKVIRYFYSKKNEANEIKVVLDDAIRDINVYLQGPSSSKTPQTPSRGTDEAVAKDIATSGEAAATNTDTAKVNTADTVPTMSYKIVSITMESQEVAAPAKSKDEGNSSGNILDYGATCASPGEDETKPLILARHTAGKTSTKESQSSV